MGSKIIIFRAFSKSSQNNSINHGFYKLKINYAYNGNKENNTCIMMSEFKSLGFAAKNFQNIGEKARWL